MKNNFLITILLLTIQYKVFSQNLTLKWTDKIEYSNKKDGFFNQMIGENSSYIYATYTNTGGSYGVEKLALVAFDKNSNKIVKQKKVFGFKELQQQNKEYKDLQFYQTLVYEKVIFIFWTKKSKDKEELFIQSFDNELTEKQKLKKVHEIRFDKKLDRFPAFFVEGNADIADGRILIGTENGGNEGDVLKFDYKILDPNFSIVQTNSVPLKFINITKAGFFNSRDKGLSSSYTLGDDGNIHVYSIVQYVGKIDKKAKKEEDSNDKRTNIFHSVIKVENGELISKELLFENKNLFSVHKTIHKNKVVLNGFYSDKDKDPLGRSINGIFYAELDNNYNIKNSKFNLFKKEFMDEVFKNEDNTERYGNDGSGCCLIGGKRNKMLNETKDERLPNDYQIKSIITNSKGETFVFCVRVNKWYHTHCTTDAKGNQTCTTTYYNSQHNITVFKLTPNGELIWGKNLYRYVRYSGGSVVWSYDDFNVIGRSDGFYMIYENRSVKNEKGKKKAKKRDNKFPFEYAYIDAENGEFQRKFYQVNSDDVPRKERKIVEPLSIHTLNGKFYVEHTKYKRKFYAYICCVIPSIYYGNDHRTGFGHIGEIKPVE